MKITNIHIALLVIFVQFQCAGQKSMSPEKYKKWYAKSNLSQLMIDSTHGIKYCMNIQPYFVDMSERTKKPSAQNLVFLMQLSSTNQVVSIRDIALTRLDQISFTNYLNGSIIHDIKGISVNNDTLKCNNVFFEPIDSRTIRLLIEMDGSKAINKLLFNDKLFSGKVIEFMYPQISYKSIPTVKLKKNKNEK